MISAFRYDSFVICIAGALILEARYHPHGKRITPFDSLASLPSLLIAFVALTQQNRDSIFSLESARMKEVSKASSVWQIHPLLYQFLISLSIGILLNKLLELPWCAGNDFAARSIVAVKSDMRHGSMAAG